MHARLPPRPVRTQGGKAWVPPPPITTRQSEAMAAGAGFSLAVGSEGEWFAVGINIVQQGPATKTGREERS